MRTPEQYYERETYMEWLVRTCNLHEDENGRLPVRIQIELNYAHLQEEEMCRDWFPQDHGFWDSCIARTRHYIDVLEDREFWQVARRQQFPGGK